MSQYKHVIGFYQILVGLGTSNLNTLTILKWQKGANLTNFCKLNNDQKITTFLHITRMTIWTIFWTSPMTTPRLFQGVYICMSCPVCQARDGGGNFHQKRGMSSSLPVCVRQSRPWCHVRFVENENLECEIKVSLRYYSTFYQHHE